MKFEFTQKDIDRFMSYVDKLPCGCWYWTGARSRGKGNKKWYGSFWVNGKTIRALSFSCWAIGGKELPEGHDRDHKCCFSMCVNPDCIDIVPKEINQKRKMERRKNGNR